MPLADLRTDDSVNLALLVHVLGAMLLVGTLLVVSVTLITAWRRTEPREVVALSRFGLRALLAGVVPAYVVMRVGAQWTQSEEDLPEEVEDTPWIAIGYITADLGMILIVLSVILAAVGLRRLRRDDAARSVPARIVGVVCAVLLAAYVVAVWAMTTKPG